MGAGIGQVAAMAGMAVTIRDVGPAELERATRAIDRSLERFVRAQRLDQEGAAAARGRVTFTLSIEEAVADARVVIEAVPEILELKETVLSEIVDHAPSAALLGTNTSQFSITRLGANLGDAADRLIGLHFFNPPVMMKLVEIVCGERTSDETLRAAQELGASLGKQVVVCHKDSPGFITTRAYAALRLECMRILEEGLASADDIDTALKLAFNLPMGPLELADFNGVDISMHVLSSLCEAYGDRFRPTVGLRNMVAAGKLGRKSGEGFHRYGSDGERLRDDDDRSIAG